MYTINHSYDEYTDNGIYHLLINDSIIAQIWYNNSPTPDDDFWLTKQEAENLINALLKIAKESIK